MKRIPGFLSASMTHLFTWVALVVCMFVSTPAFARLKVKKVTPSVGTRLGGTKHFVKIYLYCDGYDTYITRDENGRTQVYVYDDGTRHSQATSAWSKDEKYLVDIEGYDWRYADIFLGKDAKGTSSSMVSCSNTIHVKMDGGHVGTVNLNGSGVYNVTKDVYFWATGGAVESISAKIYGDDTKGYSRNGNSYISLSNVKYLGYSKIDYSDRASNTRLFINTDCDFYNSSARISADADGGLMGLIAPDPSNKNKLIANGKAVIEAGFDAICDEFEDNSSSLNISGKLHLKKCTGWKSSKNIANYPNVTLSHKHYQHIAKPATCTTAAEYISKCSVCNKELPPTVKVDALGHDSIASSTGLGICTALYGGTHCGRCGTTLINRDKALHRVNPAMRRPLTAAMGNTCFKKFNPGSNGGWGYAPCLRCGATVLFRANQFEIIPGMFQLPVHHNFVDVEESQFVRILGTAAKYAKVVQPTCTQPGRKYQYCKDCGWIIAVAIPSTPHQFTSVVSKIEATCTKEGRAAYKQCKNCHLYFLADAPTDSPNNVQLSDLVIPAKGHVYTEIPRKNWSKRVSEASCTTGALYGCRCDECGELGDVFAVEGEPARGHRYHIDHIDDLSLGIPNDGDLTMRCADCGKLEKDVPFTMSQKYGSTDCNNPDGYWCKSVLVKTDTLPSCTPGYGTYQVSVNYKGTLSRMTYDYFIPACGYIHNYDENGVCHETHYSMNMSGDQIDKDEYGIIEYTRKKSVVNTVFTSHGYIAIPRQAPCEFTSSRITTPVYDPEDGSPMTYTDYYVIQFDSRSSLEEALANIKEPHYIGTFGNYSLNSTPVLTDPNCLGVICHGGALNYTLTDATAYGATSDFNLEQFTYTRSFTNTLWQPLYVPFSVSVEELEAEGLQVARLNDTHMYDNDFDGDIDSVTVEFIRFTRGTLQANRPYMVRSATGNNTLRLNKENVALSKAVDNSIECSTVDQIISIVGTYSGLGTGVLYNNNYYALNAQGGLSRAASTAAKLKPQRWYMKVENKDGSPIATNDYFAASIRVMGEWGDEEVTGIEELPAETEAEGERQVYSLDGMRVTDGKKLQRGVYVDNGRRIVVH